MTEAEAEEAVLFLKEYLKNKREEATLHFLENGMKPLTQAQSEARAKRLGKIKDNYRSKETPCKEAPGIPSRAEKRCRWVSRKRTS